MLVGQEAVDGRVARDREQERHRDIAGQQALPFLANTVTSQTGASIDKPMNQRNSML